MPSEFAPVFSALKRFLNGFPNFHSRVIFFYAKHVFNKTRLSCHLVFLRMCLRYGVIPTGMQLRHSPADINNPYLAAQTRRLCKHTSFSLMRIHIESLSREVQRTERIVFAAKQHLMAIFAGDWSAFITHRVHDLNRSVFSLASSKKDNKLRHLIQANRPFPPIRSNFSPVTTGSQYARHIPPPSLSVSQDNRVKCIPDTLHLSSDERSVLSRGLNFVPLTRTSDQHLTHIGLERFYRTLRWQAELGHTPQPPPDTIEDDQDEASPVNSVKKNDIFTKLFFKRSGNQPPKGNFKNLEEFISRTRADFQNLNPRPLSYSNISPGEASALRSLRNRDDIVIKPADKGGSVVVWCRQAYIAEAVRQLSNQTHYLEVDHASLASDSSTIATCIRAEQAQNLLPTTANLLKVGQPRQPIFYMLPKIHKLNSPGRPIVSACSCPTEHISTFLDSIFQPIVQALPSYIKDSTDALNKLTLLNNNARLFPSLLSTMDVTGLYTNIPHNDGLMAIGSYLDKRDTQSPPTDTLVRLTELVLNLNTFEFNNRFFKQQSGVAMGTKMGPSYACLFMGHLETRLLQAYTGPKPLFYGRYIDDCLIISDFTERQMSAFVAFANGFHNSIKFTSECSKSEINFLDIHITLTLPTQAPLPHKKLLQSSVFYKETASHSYLDYRSSHNPATRDNIPFSQFLRLRRLCSEEDDFLLEAERMVDFFKNCHYPDKVIDDALAKAKLLVRENTLTYNTKEPVDRPIVVTPFHPHNTPLKGIILKHWSLLQNDPFTKEAFQQPPLFAYKRPTNIRDMLVRSKLSVNRPHTTPVTPGTQSCNHPRCKICPFLDHNTKVIGPKASFSIKKSFSCTSTNLVYVIRCTQCAMLYIGETKRTLATRTAEHLGYITKKKLEYPLGQHFNLPDHSLNNFRVQGLWLMKGDNIDRKIVESDLINRLGTKRPLGMNRKE